MFNKIIQFIEAKIHAHLTKSLSRYNAIGLSIFSHIFVTFVLASMFGDKFLIMPVTNEINLEAILVPEEEIENKKVDYSSNPTNPFSQISLNSESSCAENGPINKEEIIVAALASLNELKDSFNFIKQPIPSDSLDRFSPLPGYAPDITALINDLNNGNFFGNLKKKTKTTGGGGGNCPPGTGRYFE